VAKYFQKKYNAQIYYCQHHPSENNIKNKLGIKKLKTINLSTKEQKFAYSKLNLIIGMMLHSCVMSFGAETPEINIAYDIRNKNFAKFINCPELVILPNKLDNTILLKKAINIFEKKEKYKAKFKKRKNKIWELYKKFINDINSII
jgi:polysaccharide pyruvyl transferase WcaK-like protein